MKRTKGGRGRGRGNSDIGSKVKGKRLMMGDEDGLKAAKMEERERGKRGRM